MSAFRLSVLILLLACASALPRRPERDEESSGGGEIEHKGEPWGKPSFNDLDVPGHELFNDYELKPPGGKPEDGPPLYDFGEEDYFRPEEDEPHDSSADDNHDERKEEEEEKKRNWSPLSLSIPKNCHQVNSTKMKKRNLRKKRKGEETQEGEEE
ncbi:hypothetical protein CEXT_101691, partial [Caerostris extrusa]